MGKVEYAKFQFMVLVLKSLQMILILLTATMLRQDANQLVGEIVQHWLYIENLMKEE